MASSASSSELKKKDNRASLKIVQELRNETQKKIDKLEARSEKLYDRLHELDAILREES